MAEEPRELQKSILRAAREGFAVKGFYGTSMEFITRSAGVSKGAVYWYYPGKWEIYKAVLSEEAERIKRIVIPPGLHLTLADALDFFLIRGAAMPAVLIETGFLTEKSEARLLNDKKYQDKIAESMTRGIVDYLKNI